MRATDSVSQMSTDIDNMKNNGQDEACMAGDALNTLVDVYYKILKVNFTKDTYSEIKVSEFYDDVEMLSEKLSEWFKNFAKTHVYSEDVDDYLEFTDIDNLRKQFLDGKKYISFFYRRKVGDEFQWVSMELMPCEEYTDDNQEAFLYIKNMHNDYIIEMYEKDMLTGGINRQGFIHKVKPILTNCGDEELAFVFFDIKGFKGINELLGIEGSDKVLRYFHKILNESNLKPIALSRIEADHFVCLVKQDNIDFEEITRLCKSNYSYNGKMMTIYSKCGIYLVDDRNMKISGMMDRAKLACEDIDNALVKPYAVFDKNKGETYVDKTELIGELNSAIENEEFCIYYQPVYDAKTKKIASAEALVRWKHPKRGIVSPAVFVPALEENGHISKVDLLVEKGVKHFLEKRHNDGRYIVPVSVNLSWMDFYDAYMMNTILEDVKTSKLEAGFSRFEVTETSYAALAENNGKVLESMRKLNAKILLDDFGSGYSSFSTVSDYDFDIIKLDMGFVRKIETNEKARSIIKSIIDMAHHVNAKVIAEGAETKEQVDFLTDNDCDYIQGFYFSKPLTQEEFEKLLDESEDK